MKLATARIGGATRAVHVTGDSLIDLGVPDVGDFPALPHWWDRAADATGPMYPAADASFATLIARPSKMVCEGLNYRRHMVETAMTSLAILRCSPNSPTR